MRKRIEKKLHKKYLNDVIAEISMSSFWRKRLFQSPEKFCISYDNYWELPDYIKSVFIRNKLRYVVFRTDGVYQEKWIDEKNHNYVFFEFQAIKYPQIQGNSYNNMDVI